jgi:TonB family protein
MSPSVQPSSRPGQMTAVMRAMAKPTGSRALRAALVRGGKIVDERVLSPGEHLTVGPTERSSFVVVGLPSGVRLLEWTRAGYRLHLAAGMDGRVALGGEITQLGGAGASVTLDDEARGRIALGDALVLFHFVAAPAPAARARLPLAVKQRTFDGLDWRTTCIAAFSFLFHFGAMGTAYADFTDSVVEDDGVRVATALGVLRSMPPVLPPLEEHGAAPSDPKSPEGGPAHHGPSPGRTARPGPAHPGPAENRGGALSDARARAISQQLEAEGGLMLLAIGSRTGGSTQVVLDGPDLPGGMLDGAAASAMGTHAGATGLNLAVGGGVVRPGAVGGLRVGEAAHVGRDVHEADVGNTTGPRKPVASAMVSPPETMGGRLPDGPQVVNGLRGMLRACYKHALDEDPNMRGTVRVTAKIGPNGEVSSVQAANSGLSSSMVACVSRVVRGAQFGPPEGGAAVVNIPMTFIPQ